MIDKILNKYYSKQLISNIDHFTIPYFIDIKFMQDKKYLSLLVYIKRPKYKETEYFEICHIHCDNYIHWLSHTNELYKIILERVEEYINKENK